MRMKVDWYEFFLHKANFVDIILNFKDPTNQLNINRKYNTNSLILVPSNQMSPSVNLVLFLHFTNHPHLVKCFVFGFWNDIC